MQYELLYIVPTQYTDVEVEGVMGKVAGLVEASGGKVGRNENLGKLKLAYPIKRVRHGSYVLVYFEIEPTAVSNLERQLCLTDEVLRHQLLTLPKGAEKRTFQMVSYVAPLSEEARAEEGSREAARPVVKAPVAAAPVAPAVVLRTEPALSIEELDKKLDEILDAEEKV